MQAEWRLMTRFQWLLGVLAMAWLCGCSTVLPPARPVAYMFPTVLPMSALEECIPRETTVADIEACLARSELKASLLEMGLQPGDLAIMARGLSKRGYAELDARRVKGRLQWVSVCYLKAGTILRASYSSLPSGLRKHAEAVQESTEGTLHFERDPYGNVKVITEYPGPKSNSILRQVKSPKKSHWEIRWTLP